MKRQFALLAVVLVMAGCFGGRSRTSVLYPAVESAWPQVAVDAVRGGLPETVADNFGVALSMQDAETVAELWPTVKAAAEEGIRGRIDAGLVSAGVGASLYERVSNMDASVMLLKRRPP